MTKEKGETDIMFAAWLCLFTLLAFVALMKGCEYEHKEAMFRLEHPVPEKGGAEK